MYEVLTHIGGSHCVAAHRKNSIYIDAKKDIRFPEISFIEVIANGYVIEAHQEFNTQAPEKIIELMRKHA